jgi:Spy/CpxP family protein refolding chaperone
MKQAFAIGLAGMLTIPVSTALQAAPTSADHHAAIMIIAQVDRPPDAGHGRRDRGPGWPGAAERERARIRIGLTKDQEKRIERFHEASAKRRQAIATQMRDSYRELRKLYDTYDFDRAKADRLRKRILALHQQRMELFGQNEEELRKIMTREQFMKMRAMMQEEWQKRAHRPDQRPPAPGGEDMAPPGRPR